MANKPGKSPVYPRAYGEHFRMISLEHHFHGLSPCIRGTPSLRWVDSFTMRFIPVHTGNMASLYSSYSSESVYPRAYGEHYAEGTNTGAPNGLSPCIRGTLLGEVPIVKVKRFIPVHTGNTIRKRLIIANGAVYPRAYGEHSNHNRLNIKKKFNSLFFTKKT